MSGNDQDLLDDGTAVNLKVEREPLGRMLVRRGAVATTATRVRRSCSGWAHGPVSAVSRRMSRWASTASASWSNVSSSGSRTRMPHSAWTTSGLSSSPCRRRREHGARRHTSGATSQPRRAPRRCGSRTRRAYADQRRPWCVEPGNSMSTPTSRLRRRHLRVQREQPESGCRSLDPRRVTDVRPENHRPRTRRVRDLRSRRTAQPSIEVLAAQPTASAATCFEPGRTTKSTPSMSAGSVAHRTAPRARAAVARRDSTRTDSGRQQRRGTGRRLAADLAPSSSGNS